MDSPLSTTSTASSTSIQERRSPKLFRAKRNILDLNLGPDMFIRMKSSNISDHYEFIEKIGEGSPF